MKTAVRSGELGKLVRAIEGQGLRARVEEVSAASLREIPEGDRIYGFPSEVSAGDRIFLIDVSSIKNVRPNKYYRVTVE